MEKLKIQPSSIVRAFSVVNQTGEYSRLESDLVPTTVAPAADMWWSGKPVQISKHAATTTKIQAEAQIVRMAAETTSKTTDTKPDTLSALGATALVIATVATTTLAAAA